MGVRGEGDKQMLKSSDNRAKQKARKHKYSLLSLTVNVDVIRISGQMTIQRSA